MEEVENLHIQVVTIYTNFKNTCCKNVIKKYFLFKQLSSTQFLGDSDMFLSL